MLEILDLVSPLGKLFRQKSAPPRLQSRNFGTPIFRGGVICQLFVTINASKHIFR